jgi:hypothetical protein
VGQKAAGLVHQDIHAGHPTIALSETRFPGAQRTRQEQSEPLPARREADFPPPPGAFFATEAISTLADPKSLFLLAFGQVFMDWKNSSLFLDDRSLSSRNSMAS